MTYVACNKCGSEQPDMGPGVECPVCGHGPMPTKKPKRCAICKFLHPTDKDAGKNCLYSDHAPTKKQSAPPAPIPSTNKTKYGFRDGPAEVQRICTETDGSVVIAVVTARQRLEIRVTKSGLIRFGLVPNK